MKILPILLLCLPLVAHAEGAEFDDNDFDQAKPWSEITVQLPAYPKDADLIPFKVSSATRNDYFIDAKSISVGSDKVVRYTVVIRAAEGARNVSFEGIRCESDERRLYAYGHPDDTWSRARNGGWEPIHMRSQLSYQKALYEDYFCTDGINVKDSKEAVKRLRRAAR